MLLRAASRVGASSVRSASAQQQSTFLLRQAHTQANNSGSAKQAPNLYKRAFKVSFGVAGAMGAGYLALLSFPVAAEQETPAKREKVVVLGSGWAAVSFLRHIDTKKYEVTCVSPRNFFLMTPLLPSVAVGTIEDRTVVEPLRPLLGNHIKFVEAECVDIDPKTRLITCKSSGTPSWNAKETTQYGVSQITRETGDDALGSSSRKILDSCRVRPPFQLEYDKLVVAVGAENNTFGIPGVEKHAHFLKELQDARRIRAAISDCFESASIPGISEEERKRLLHFVVVGGGPTGVEYAAELSDMVHEDLSKYYTKLCKEDVRITLIEALDHILTAFDRNISEWTEQHFAREEIQVAPNTFVKEVKHREVVIQKKGQQPEAWPCAMVVWATGIKSRPLVERLRTAIGTDVQHNRHAILTDQWLEVKGLPNVYALGDCASIEQEKLLVRLEDLFKEADQGGKGGITAAEFGEFVHKYAPRYPQLKLYTQDVQAVFQAHDNNADALLSLDEFKEILKQADNKLRALPATAQVAYQEGRFAADSFNTGPYRQEYGDKPFQYKHLGSLAYVGADQAVADFKGTAPILNFFELGPMQGWGTFVLWRSFYLTEMFTARTRILLAFDWMRTKLFGRDISRV